MPRPRQWESPDLLVQDMKGYEWKRWFEKERKKEAANDLHAIIRNAVGGNTFRAFHKLPQKPSETFRDWAHQALTCDFLATFQGVNSESEYEDWIARLVHDFQDHWRDAMKVEMPFGPSFKLPNLLVKRLCLYSKVPIDVFERVVWFLHVPLDSYTIQAVRNCVDSFSDSKAIGKIPGAATMSFIKNAETYKAFQSGIKALAVKAVVPPITLDCLAWDAGHK